MNVPVMSTEPEAWMVMKQSPNATIEASPNRQSSRHHFQYSGLPASARFNNFQTMYRALPWIFLFTPRLTRWGEQQELRRCTISINLNPCHWSSNRNSIIVFLEQPFYFHSRTRNILHFKKLLKSQIHNTQYTTVNGNHLTVILKTKRFTQVSEVHRTKLSNVSHTENSANLYCKLCMKNTKNTIDRLCCKQPKEKRYSIILLTVDVHKIQCSAVCFKLIAILPERNIWNWGEHEDIQLTL